MKQLFLLSITFGLLFNTKGQAISEVDSKIVVKDTVKVNILSVVPDSFPLVSIVFKAQTRSGYPLWDLTSDKVKVTENSDSCRVVSFKSLTKEQGIKMALVVDHSGSMMSDYGAIYTDLQFYYFKQQIMEQSPLTKAKRAINGFVSDLDFSKDKVCVVGFSSFVDLSTKLFDNKTSVMSSVNKLEIEGGTAFYDATYKAIQNLKDEETGVKIIVALTDGDDNSSSTSLDRVISFAKQHEIPVYVIGLGQVTISTLQRLANETKGEFFYARNSSSLNDVYEMVRKKINALYEVKYESVNLSSSDTLRNVYLSFNIDDLVTEQVSQSYDVPVAVREKLKAIEQAKLNETIFIYSGIGAFVLIAGGVFFVLRKKKKDNNLRYT